MPIKSYLSRIFEKWIDEYHQDIRYGMKGKVLVKEKSNFQEITIIESNKYGKALLLDGCWMAAEYLEKHYHECLVHPALSSAENIKNILIIGGGDGGTARECLKYKEVENIDLIEIDRRVVELSQQFLPGLGGNAWMNSRLNIIFEDGIEWVKNSNNHKYDVILVDGSDPKGPANGLFNQSFFENCRRILKTNGIFATQSESPEAFKDIHIEIVKTLRKVFEYADPLYGNVPIYPSGWWSWSFAADEKPIYKTPISDRAKIIEEDCEVWSSRWQNGAFNCIPSFIERELKK